MNRNTSPPVAPDLSLIGTEEFAERIAVLVKSTVDSGRFRPPLLPHVAVKLNTIASRLDVDIADVEETVIKDPSIAARLVSVANSALYARGTPLTSLRASIVRLGIPQVRDVAFQVVTMTKLFRVPGYTERIASIFNTAHSAGLIAKQVCLMRGGETDSAYLAGLLHDIGEVAVLGIVADAYQKIGRPPPLEDLRVAILRHHAQVGGYVCDKWRLSDVIIDAVNNHHDASKSRRKEKMAHVVALTDMLLAHAGIGTDWVPMTKASESVFEQLGIRGDKVDFLLRFAESLVQPVQEPPPDPPGAPG